MAEAHGHFRRGLKERSGLGLKVDPHIHNWNKVKEFWLRIKEQKET